MAKEQKALILKELRKKFILPIINSVRYRRSRTYKFKAGCNFNELCIAADSIDKNSNINNYIFGNPLPKQYSLLGRLEKNEYILCTEDLTKELNWTILCVRHFRNQINEFLKYKELFENSFLIGDYLNAEEYLSHIETHVCVSIWSLEKRFLLLEHSKTPEAHKSYLSEFNSTSQGYFSASLALYLSNRSEQNFSVLKYNSDSQAIFAGRTGDHIESNKQFYFTYINFFETWKYSEYAQILAFDSFHSIVDRYLTLMRLLKIGATDKSISADIILSRVKYLSKKIDDRELKSLLIHLSPGENENYNDYGFNLEILDAFTKGEYQTVLDILKTELITHANRFELYETYVKSLIYSNKELVFVNSGNTFQNMILKELYFQIIKESNPTDSSMSISRLCKALSSFSVSDGLHRFYDHEFNPNEYWNSYNKRTLSFDSPEFSELYASEDERRLFLSNLSRKRHSSIAIKFYQSINNKDFEFKNLALPSYISELETAKIINSGLEKREAVMLYRNIIRPETPVPVVEEAIFRLYHLYIELDLLSDAVKLYVDQYVINKYIVQRLKPYELRNRIRKDRFKSITNDINLPIFYSITNSDENEIHRTYELFNDSMGIRKPSELNLETVEIDRAKLTLFLNLTCTVEIFKHSDYINGTKEGFIERIEVCRLLRNLDLENSDSYKHEINQLTEFIIIQDGIRQLDESKIYVNEQGLITSELKDFEGLFRRYQTISSMSQSEKAILLIPKTGIVALTKGEDGIIEAKNYFSQNPLADTFREIFDIILDKFLNSKFGITAYLSTRIRHGVLLGEIRPIFESLNLIAQYDKHNEQYKEIEYWNDEYEYLSNSDRKSLQDQLIKLSRTVDGLIYDLLKKQLQIRTSLNETEGWFDYYFDDFHISLYSLKFKNSDDYTKFIKGIFEALWIRTDKNLEIIRNNIQGEIKSQFTEALSKCSFELRQKFPGGVVPEVSTNVMTCITEIQHALDRIASWFNRSGSQTSDFNFHSVINIVRENIKQSSRQLDLSVEISGDLTLKGEYYPHIADLFRIFLENALNHSIQTYKEIPCKIVITVEDNLASIFILNSYPDPEKILDMTDQNKQELNLVKLSSEGNSGFHKVLKILKSDLRNEANTCFREITSDGKYSVNLVINIEHLRV